MGRPRGPTRLGHRAAGRGGRGGRERTPSPRAAPSARADLLQAERALQRDALRSPRRKREAAHLESSRLFDLSPVATFVVAADGAIRKVNRAGARLLGVEQGRLPGLRLGSFVRQGDAGRLEQLLAPFARAEQPEEAAASGELELRVGGRSRRVRATAQRLPRPPGDTSAALLCLEEPGPERPARALREALERLRIHVESTPLGLVEWDAQYRVTGFSRRAEEILGWSAAEVLGRRIDEIPWVPREDWPSVRAVMRDMASGARPASVNANRNVRKDGRAIHCEWYSSALSDEAGRLSSILSFVLDVTERKEAEARTEYVARFPAENPDPVLRLDQALSVGYANEAARALLGREAVAPGAPAPAALAGPAREAMARGVPVHAELRVGEAQVAIRAVPVGREVNLYGHDVTARRRAEEALQASMARARAVAENVSDTLIELEAVRDPEGRAADWRYAAVNDAAVEAMGLPRERLLGRTLREVQPDRHAALHERLARVLEGGAVEQYEESRHGRASLARIFRIDPGAVGIAALDITERKRAEELAHAGQRRLRALADSIPQLAWTAEPDGYITWYNRRWYEYTGTTPEQMAGWGWQAVHDPAALPQVVERWRASLASARPFEMEFPLRRADGAYRHFLTRAYPLVDDAGRVLQWFGTNTDVTELVEAQEALREADRRKDEFLGVLSHELRNPLAPIRNAAYLLEHAEAGSGEAARARGVLRRQSDHLARLVDDLLDVTRITRGRIALQPRRMDLGEAVARAADDVRSWMAERGVSLRTALPAGEIWIDADPTRVNQIALNLLHNAAKFTRSGDEVVVSVEVSEGAAELRVRDTGAGVDPGLLPRLFEPFVQGERTLDRSEGGLGLGLALVKGLAELHDGEVRAESAGVGQGAMFAVRLPLAPAGPAPAASGQPGAGGRHRVLVVDDNRDAAESLADVLRMLGHEAEIATDGPSALARVGPGGADVVVCDIGLPGMDGYEVARAIRAGAARGVRLVALTGYAREEDVRRAAEAGFDAHVAKPLDPERLAALLG